MVSVSGVARRCTLVVTMMHSPQKLNVRIINDIAGGQSADFPHSRMSDGKGSVHTSVLLNVFDGLKCQVP